MARFGRSLASDDQFPRFYVQGETVRNEPRAYWVVDRKSDKQVSKLTRDHRQAMRWRKLAELGETLPQ